MTTDERWLESLRRGMSEMTTCPCNTNGTGKCEPDRCNPYLCKYKVGLVGWAGDTQKYFSYDFHHSAATEGKCITLVVYKDCYANYECDKQCDGCENIMQVCLTSAQLVEAIKKCMGLK